MPERLPDAPPPAPSRNAIGDHVSFRLAVFATLLVVTLLAGYGLGRLTTISAAADPARRAPAGPAGMPGMAADEGQPHAHSPGSAASGTASTGGLAISAHGLTLVPQRTAFPGSAPQRLTFTITGAGGVPVTTYATVHDKALHLIVIRRDLSGFQHLHPTMAPDGTWTIGLVLPAAGSYRAIADFTAIVGGRQVPTSLGADLTVAGSYAPVALPEPARQAIAGGLSVAYGGTPRTGSTQPILVRATGPGGRAVALQPYLGAFGHLVVLRQGDLGYVHVHPEPQLVDGAAKFWLAAPSAGTYRMFFDFRAGGEVHTAAWTVTVS